MGARIRAVVSRFSRGEGAWAEVGRTAVAKFGVMGFAALFSIWTQNLIITQFGAPAYEQYALIATFPVLLPFADLGLGAIIFNTVAEADDPGSSPRVRAAIMTVIRILVVSAAVFGAIAILLLVSGMWPVILGSSLMPGGEVTATICLIIFAAGFPLAVGQRIIVGLGRSSVKVAAQGVVSPLMLIFTALLVLSRADPAGTSLSVWSYIANMMVSVICLFLAWRWVDPGLKEAIKDVPKLRSVPSIKVGDIVGPNLMLSILNPIALQIDRVLLSQWGQAGELGQYHLANTFFQMLSQTVMVASVAMWPVFAKARAKGELRSPVRASFAMAGVALVGSAALSLVVPWAVRLISDGEIEVSWLLCAAFTLYITVDAANYPLSMYMTDARGLRFQVVPLLLLVPLKIGLTWWLIARFGAGAPLFASSIAVVLCQIIPYTWYVQRDLKRRRAEALTEGDAEQQESNGESGR